MIILICLVYVRGFLLQTEENVRRAQELMTYEASARGVLPGVRSNKGKKMISAHKWRSVAQSLRLPTCEKAYDGRPKFSSIKEEKKKKVLLIMIFCLRKTVNSSHC